MLEQVLDENVFAMSVGEIDLDFGTSKSGSMLESIGVHLGIISARDRIAKNCKHGRTFKERIQNAKQVTGGIIFRNSSSGLGKLSWRFNVKEKRLRGLSKKVYTKSIY